MAFIYLHEWLGIYTFPEKPMEILSLQFLAEKTSIQSGIISLLNVTECYQAFWNYVYKNLTR